MTQATYAYDAVGRLAQVATKDTTTPTSPLVTNYGYDGVDRLRALRTSEAGTTISGYQYQTDRLGLRTAITEILPLSPTLSSTRIKTITFEGASLTDPVTGADSVQQTAASDGTFSAPFAASAVETFTSQATRFQIGATSSTAVAITVDDITLDTAAFAAPSALLAARTAATDTPGTTRVAAEASTSAVNLPMPDTSARQANFGRLPLSFVPNAGQAADATTRFMVRGIGGVLAFSPGELAMALRTPAKPRGTSTDAREPQRRLDSRVPPTIVRTRWIGANLTAVMTGTLALPGRANYLIGTDPTKWRTRLATYADVLTRQLYPGIDLYYQGLEGQLKRTYVVAAGADPSRIRWSYQGASDIKIDAAGNLVVSLPAPASTLTDTQALSSTLTELAPVAWQTINEREVAVPVRFVIGTGGIVSFALGAYDTTQPLTIDPVLMYSTYLAGSGNDYGYGIAVDSAGNSYVTGRTASAIFPISGSTNAGGYDVFVSKLNAAGNALIYSTLLGGIGNDEGYEIAVDSAGNAAVTGSTNWSDFPIVNPLTGQGSYQGCVDAFVAKLNASGSGLIYSTYLGGSADEYGNGIALDSSGNAYVSGQTLSTNFPTTVGARQTVKAAGEDAFVTKLVWNGTTLSYGYSTFLGGNLNDQGTGIAVDGLGNAYIVGKTTSTIFPTANPLQSTCGDTAPATAPLCRSTAAHRPRRPTMPPTRSPTLASPTTTPAT